MESPGRATTANKTSRYPLLSTSNRVELNFCAAIGHYENVCRKKRAINRLESDSEPNKHQAENYDHSDVYHIKIFRTADARQHQPSFKGRLHTRDFNTQSGNNNMDESKRKMEPPTQNCFNYHKDQALHQFDHISYGNRQMCCHMWFHIQ